MSRTASLVGAAALAASVACAGSAPPPAYGHKVPSIRQPVAGSGPSSLLA